ncbi:MAG: EVE domain-containing protein [Chloroflexi bacterium]|nr:EVE domain-containing protein [Chloroflexota bacterium]
MGKTYWMLVTTQENLSITRARGFSIQGVDTKNRKKAVRMAPEDRVLYYISDKQGFAATATVTSDSFEDEERIWKHHKENETFPHRVEIDADVVLDEAKYIDGLQVGPTLEYVKKWPPHLWPYAFYGMLHIIPQRDFNFVEGELRRANGMEPTLPVSDPIPAPLVAIVSGTEPPEGSGIADADQHQKLFSVALKSRKSSHRRRTQKHR